MTSELKDRLQAAMGAAYTLDRELGGGGMSRVFVATETQHGRAVVVKVLAPELAEGLSNERFTREIRLAAGLQQANIVPLLTSGVADGLPYFTMPFVEGQSLRARLVQGNVPLSETMSVLRDVARALAYAHDHGTVHRDIKPDNILLSGGTAVVADFGIAKAIQAARTGSENGGPTASATLTQLGMSIGTPAYIAPEQAAGDPAVDHRADIYSFGCVAYEMVAGHPPFHGLAPHKLLVAHMGQAPRPIRELRPDLPASFADLIMQCLAKDPDGRPQRATEILRALDAVVTTSGAGVAMPAHLLAKPFRTSVALVWWGLSLAATYILARAAIVGIGLPSWVLQGALIVAGLGLPAIIVTGFVQRTARRAALTTPTLTPRGSAVAPGAMATLALQAAPHVTWRRTRTMGMVSAGVFALVVTAAMALRAAGIGPFASLQSAGAFGAREPLVVAEFAAVGDTTLGPVIAEAVRADLAQSRAVALITPAGISNALERMGRARDARLSVELARELSLREGYKGVVAGEVRRLGTSYLVTLRLVSADSGRELASFRRTAKSADDLIATASTVARELRAKIGESLRDVQRSPTTDKVTTPSLVALRNYTQANEALYQRGDFPEFTRLMTEAINADTGFAMAYRRLGVELANRGLEWARAESLLVKAYTHRDRLSAYERAMAEGSYFSQGPVAVTDIRLARDAYRRAVDADPASFGALNNTAVMATQLGEAAAAESLYRRAIAVENPNSATHTNLAYLLGTVGRLDAQDSAIREFKRKFPRNAQVPQQEAIMMLNRRQYDSAETLLSREMTAASANASRKEALANTLSNAQIFRGRWRQGEAMRDAVAAEQAVRGELVQPINAALARALRHALVFGPGVVSRAIVDSVARSGVIERLPYSDRPYQAIAQAASYAGDVARAEQYAALSARQLTGRDTTIRAIVHYDNVNVAIAKGDFALALRELPAAELGVDSWRQARAVRAWLHDRMGHADSARVWWEKVASGAAGGPYAWGVYIPLAWERLGILYEQNGDVEKAVLATQEFIRLWTPADEALQPRVREAKRRLEQLRARVAR